MFWSEWRGAAKRVFLRIHSLIVVFEAERSSAHFVNENTSIMTESSSLVCVISGEGRDWAKDERILVMTTNFKNH